MKTSRRVREAGLSLVELLLGLALTALVMLPLLPMLQTASAADAAAADQAALERDADFALNRIAARLRGADPNKIGNGKTLGDWFSPGVPYDLNVINGSLVEQGDKVSYVLAESVTGFSIDTPPATSSEPLLVLTLKLARGTASTNASVTVRAGSLP